MRKFGVGISVVALVAALLPVTVLTAVGATGDPVLINELLASHSGTDDTEYIELYGTPGTSLSGLSLIVVESDAFGAGEVDRRLDFLPVHEIGANGFFLAGNCGGLSSNYSTTPDTSLFSNYLENSSLTVALVETATAPDVGDSLTGSEAIKDAVALTDGDSEDTFYFDAPVIGPDGSFFPAGARRVADGIDTDAAADWVISDFFLGSANTPTGGGFDGCSPIPLKINQIQGSGFSSPFNGVSVQIEGVVVGDFQGTSFAGEQLGGFYVQEEATSGEQDLDPLTSEGIFVFDPGAPDVGVGDVVQVTGTVDEFFGLTQIGNVTDVTITGSDPASVVATTVSLPITGDIDFEKVEGMLVTFPQDLYISEFFNFDRFGEIVLTTGRQYQGTHVALPGSAANAVAEANDLARIMLDDGRDSSNPDPAIHPNGEEFTLTNTFRGGDILQGVTGAMHYSFGNYKIEPTAGAEYSSQNTRPTSPDPIDGDIRVATFNVLNFFTHLDDGSDDCGPTGNLECRGANDANEYQRQLDKLVAGIIALDADIVGIQEIENDIRTGDGDRAHDPILTLVEELNSVEGDGTWAWGGEADHYNDYPVRNEIIYKPASVSPEGDPVAYADQAFDQKRPGDIEPVGRPPLAQTFRPAVERGQGGQKFAVVVNHFKSKGSSCSSIGDPDTGDGQANCNLTRVAQAHALLDFVSALENEVAGVLVIGDLNSYAMEDPIRTLESAGLTDLLERFVGPNAYTYVFDGQLGYLDYAMATRSMLNWVSGVTSFHINADEPDILDYDTSFKKDAQDDLYEPLPYRVSDHDPVIVGIDMPSAGRGQR
jgi:predicted extracellular nuclease